MADEVTDKDLQERRDRIEKLRGEIRDAESQRAEREAAQSRAVQAAQLDAEIARLESQRNAAKERAKVSEVRGGATGPLAQAKEQIKAAQAQANQPVGPVDTNADSSSGK